MASTDLKKCSTCSNEYYFYYCSFMRSQCKHCPHVARFSPSNQLDFISSSCCCTIQGQAGRLSHETAPLFAPYIFILPELSAIQIAEHTVFHWLHLWLWGRPRDKSKLMTHCDCESLPDINPAHGGRQRDVQRPSWNCFHFPPLTVVLYKKPPCQPGNVFKSISFLVSFMPTGVII